LRRSSADGATSPPLASTALWLAVALVVGVAFPAVNYWELLLLFLSGPTDRLWQWYWRRRSADRRASQLS
jgi:hypothetical protein